MNFIILNLTDGVTDIDLMQISPIFECCIRTYNGSYGFITLFEECVYVTNVLISRVVDAGTSVLQVGRCGS